VGPRILDSSGIFRDPDEGRVFRIFRDEDVNGESMSVRNAIFPPSRALRGGYRNVLWIEERGRGIKSPSHEDNLEQVFPSFKTRIVASCQLMSRALSL